MEFVGELLLVRFWYLEDFLDLPLDAKPGLFMLKFSDLLILDLLGTLLILTLGYYLMSHGFSLMTLVCIFLRNIGVLASISESLLESSSIFTTYLFLSFFFFCFYGIVL